MVLFLAIMCATVSASAEEIIFEDDFDSYGVGALPTGWDLKVSGAGYSNQVVVDSQNVSPLNSLKLEGSSSTWPGAVYHDLPETPDQVIFEVDVNVLQGSSLGSSAKVSIANSGPFWGEHYASVDFGADSTNQWYHVKIKADMVNRVYDVWIDDVQVGSNLLMPADGYYNAVWLAGYGSVLFDNVKVTVPENVLEVPIDIRPGSDENPVNLKSEGLVPVAILGSGNFDVANVDVTTIRFGPNEVTADKWVYKDVNSDGFTDMLLHFYIKDIGITDVHESLTLTSELLDGSSITGTDSVNN